MSYCWFVGSCLSLSLQLCWWPPVTDVIRMLGVHSLLPVMIVVWGGGTFY